MNIKLLPLTLSMLVLGCSSKTDDTGHASDHMDADSDADADGYAFDSRFEDGSSVSYSGQIMRQALITEMKAYLGDLTDRIDSGDCIPAPGEVESDLLFYFEFDSEVGGDLALMSVPGNSEQTTFNDISSGKNLIGKIAGNDPATDHRDWSAEFTGWAHPDVSSPESLVRHWISEIDAAAVARAAGTIEGNAVYTTADGVNRQQLLQKFLMGAVTFSQGADDYLDWSTEGKGLLADNTEAAEEGKAYSALEHAWDEGFGYFGANRTFGLMAAADIKADGGQDADDDGMIDLTSEYVWGASMNAAKRDVGATVETDMVGDAWLGFQGGRAIIADADGALSDDDMTALEEHALLAVGTWEMAVAATVIHYINAINGDLGAVGTEAYSFDDYAKHWGEAKGFALWFQFNPHSLMTDGDFAELHDLLGQTAPGYVPEGTEDPVTYINGLMTAREIICTTYAFEADNCSNW